MNSKEEKIKADKFALIYQFNNNSPLFCRVASKHLEEGELDQALPILEEGLKKYPEYPTGIIMYGLALAMAGEKDLAKQTINRLDGYRGLDNTISYYVNKIENISEDETSEIIHSIVSPFTEEIHDSGDSDIIDESPRPRGLDEEEEIDDLEELATRLKNATIPKVNEVEVEGSPVDRSEQFSGKSLVSETLAKIYFNQGNYQEALSIYETLIEIQPDKKEYYQQLIDQINAKMKK